MIDTFKKHLSNDLRLAQAAWAHMDTLGHMLVIMGLTLLLLCADMLKDRIHL